VFVHKAEKLADDDKLGKFSFQLTSPRPVHALCFSENFRQIHERLNDRLLDLNPAYEEIALDFHLTSVYDHSLREAFSKVLHKLIDSLPYLEDLLNVFCGVRNPSALKFSKLT
jgi:Ras-related GTP-binding protein C/D